MRGIYFDDYTIVLENHEIYESFTDYQCQTLQQRISRTHEERFIFTSRFYERFDVLKQRRSEQNEKISEKSKRWKRTDCFTPQPFRKMQKHGLYPFLH